VVTSRALSYAVAAGQVLRAHARPLDSPLKLTFALTYWCQYRCKTCNIWQRKPVDELSTQEVFDFIDRNRQISWLDLTGGEIFLRKDIGEILERLVVTWKRLVILHFPTNGFLTDAIARSAARIAGKGTAQIIVTVSVDGDEALNDELRGIKGGFRRQVETFRALRSIRGIRPVFGMTLSAGNAGRFEETFRACQRECPELTIQEFHLNVAQISRHYYGNDVNAGVVPDASSARHDLHRYQELRGHPIGPGAWLEDQYLRHLDEYLSTGHTPMPCHSLRSSCFIDPWGTVYPCITYDRPVGSLRDTGMELAPIWAGSNARARQTEIWNGDCPQCWTACEAYPSILGNLLRPVRWHAAPRAHRDANPEAPCTHEPT
jgi:radical SAM protein with 4Fe4S-binding SPASM domain